MIISLVTVTEVNIDVAIKGVSLGNEKFYVQELFSTLLGGDCSARLYKELREKQGLAYLDDAMLDIVDQFKQYVANKNK